jgi:2'-5' RNA ligase
MMKLRLIDFSSDHLPGREFDYSLTFIFLLSILATGMDLIRSFIAFELPPDVQDQLGEFITSLKVNNPCKIRWLSPRNIHLTVKFLGDIYLEDIPNLITVLEGIKVEASPMETRTDKIGAFPNLNNIRVIWLGLKVPPEMNKIVDAVEHRLLDQGFPKEKRGFTSHLTLGRLSYPPPPQQRKIFTDLLTSIPSPAIKPFMIDSLTLFKSELRPTGAFYTTIHKSTFPS